MSQKLQFHSIHGGDIALNDQSNEACRFQNATNALVCTSASIQINQKITFQLMNIVNEFPDIISVGFTSHDPQSLHQILPTSHRRDLRLGFWTCPLPKNICIYDTVLFFSVNSRGNIKYGMDGEVKGTVESYVDTRGSLWGVFELWSPHTAIQLKPVMFHQFRSRKLKKIQENCLYKTNSCVHPSYAFTFAPLEVNEIITTKLYNAGALALGVTSCNPSSLRHGELPEDVDFLLDRPEYWVIIDNRERSFHGDTISYSMTNEGTMKIWKKSSQLVDVIHVDQSAPLWGFFTLYSVRSIEVASFLTNHTEMGTTVPVPLAPPMQAEISTPVLLNTEQPIPQGATSSEWHNLEQVTPCAPPRMKRKKDDSPCAICWENATEVALIPCGHICMCFTCAEIHWRNGGDWRCPICREQIQSILKIYKS